MHPRNYTGLEIWDLMCNILEKLDCCGSYLSVRTTAVNVTSQN